jgi:tight adherence protein B
MIIIGNKLYAKHQKTKSFNNIKKYYLALALKNQDSLLDDGKITDRAQEIVKKIRLLNREDTKDKKGNFITELKYKLLYAYGTDPIKHFVISYLKAFIALCVIPYFLNFNIVYVILFSAIASIYGGISLANRAYDKKIAKFLDNFVYAMDIIVRGVRSGLPINICFQKIVDDIDITVGEQFLAIIDDFRLGMTVDQAMDRFMKRLPLKEVNFFCLSIMIQGKTGGNLGEIINNLAQTLRKRKSMILKIQTLSSEAKTSMKIMMSMPLCIVLLLKFVAPDYINVLFDKGQHVILGCIIWMSIGGLIMRNMINFYK